MDALRVEYLNDAYHVRRGKALFPILKDNAPLRSLQPGWHAHTAFQASATLIVLALLHDDGRWAMWFLDTEFRYRTNMFSDLPIEERIDLEGVTGDQLALVCADHIYGTGISCRSGSVATVFTAAAASETVLFEAALASACPECRSVVLESNNGVANPDALEELTSIWGDRFDSKVLSNFFRQNLLEQQIAAAKEGILTMPSPIDGTLLAANAAWCLVPDGLAYRFTPRVSPAEDTFFALMYGFQMTLFGVYFPFHRLFIHVVDRHRAQIQRVLRANPERLLWKQIAQFADCMSNEPGGQTRPVLLRSYDHVGHHLWNELGGLDETLRSVGPEATLPILVVNPEATEMYGKIEEIFPEFEGKVFRALNFRVMAETVYKERLLPLRPTGHHVSRSLARRIIDVAKRTYMTAATASLAKSLSAKGFHFVLLGLRVENRTVVDFPAFCEEIIEFLAAELGRVAIIIDGQNCAESGFQYRVTHQGSAPASPLEIEQDIVHRLSERFADRPDIFIVSTIGRPVGVSIVLGELAEFFITPWGAGLAKYRWVSNLPGLALAGPSCEKFQPIHLYDDLQYIEAPAPMYFMGPGETEDAPDDAVLMPSGFSDRVNIRVNREALHTRLRSIIKIHATTDSQPRDNADL